MANLYTYRCELCGYTDVFREDNSLHCPHCRAWPMRELNVDTILAMIDAVLGHDDAEMMAVEAADKARRRRRKGSV